MVQYLKDGKDVTQEVFAAAKLRIAKARTQLLSYRDPQTQRNPFIFWATCALHLKPVPAPGMISAGGYIGTDGVSMYYDPLWIAEGPWSNDQLKGVIAHEVSHCVKGDRWRRGGRDPRKWNIACDARIDPELMRHGLKLPSHGAELDPIIQNPANYGRSAEEIYKELPDDICKPEAGGEAGEANYGDPLGGDVQASGTEGDQAPGGGQPAQSKAECEAAAAAMERKWQTIARQAAAIAKAQGTLSGSMEHLVQPVKPRLDPYEMMRHFVSMCRRDDYSFGRQNRRSVWRGLVLPTLYSEGVGELLIAADTSGSCANDIPKFLGFLNSVLTEIKPERVVFMECDTMIHKVTEFGPGDELPAQVPVHGYGGTSMRPIWEKATELQLDPVCAIVMTDLEMTEHDLGEQQAFPVLWVSTEEGREAAWGETVYLNR